MAASSGTGRGYLLGRGVIDLARRLVAQQQLGPVGQSHGDGHALLLAAGQLRQAVLAVLPQPHHLEQLARPGPFLARGHALDGHWQLDVFLGGEVGHQVAGRLLPDKADLGAAVFVEHTVGRLEQVAAVDGQPAGRRPVQPTQDVEQRALARARGADDAHQLAGLHGEVQPLEGHHFQAGDLEDLDQVLTDEKWFHGLNAAILRRLSVPAQGH